MKNNCSKKIVFRISAIVCIVVFLLSLLSGCVERVEIISTISLTISQSPVEISVGDSVQLTAECSDQSESAQWFSSDESVVTLRDGLVTGVAEGVARVYAICGDINASCEVIVNPKNSTATSTYDSVIVSLTPITIETGETFVLEATSPTSGSIVWYSADTSVATVEDGVITGISVGETYVVASVGGSSVKCNVAVTDATIHPSVEALRHYYVLAWDDEFDGDTLDETKWGYQLGTGADEGLSYWGNNEQQYYTDSSENVGVQDGCLYITAKNETAEDRNYTSARILTRNKFSFTYGYIEAKMKLPEGTGLWPAFWMLPQNSAYGSWPDSGEIDIMEARGRVTSSVGVALHYSSEIGTSVHQTMSDTGTLTSSISEWHTYGVEWTSKYITWYVDGAAVMTIQNTVWNQKSTPTTSAPFDNPFYVLLNLAVGGNYDSGRTPDSDFVPATMLVDYVRVFKKIYA